MDLNNTFKKAKGTLTLGARNFFTPQEVNCWDDSLPFPGGADNNFLIF